jgi:hypothetical protein
LALDDLELHALDLVVKKAVERHLERDQKPEDRVERGGFKMDVELLWSG